MSSIDDIGFQRINDKINNTKDNKNKIEIKNNIKYLRLLS